MKTHYAALVFATFLTSALPIGAFAQATTSLAFDTGDFILNDASANPLSVGSVLQFGYYAGATSSDPATLFSGDWVPLTGEGGLNSGLTFTAIGGLGGGEGEAGRAGYPSLLFITGSLTHGIGLPAAGQVLALRFYDSPTVSSATLHGAVSNTSWLWVTPSESSSWMAYSLNDPGIIWLNGNVAFTGAAIPEPAATTAFAALAVLTLIVLYRRYFQLCIIE